MKKITFEERLGKIKYLLHTVTPIPVEAKELTDDGIITTEGEELHFAFYNEKGTFFCEKVEGQWYKIEEDIGNDEEAIDGPWMDNPYYYDRGYVVVFEGTTDKENYILDGCNLYPQPKTKRKSSRRIVASQC